MHKSYAFLLQYSCMYLYFTDTDVWLKNGHLKCKQFDLPYNLHNVSVFHTVDTVDSRKINEVFQGANLFIDKKLLNNLFFCSWKGYHYLATGLN